MCPKLVCCLIWRPSQFRLKKKIAAHFLQIIISTNISKSEIFLFCNNIETAVGWNWVVIQCIITLISSLALVVLIIFQKYFTQCLFLKCHCSQCPDYQDHLQPNPPLLNVFIPFLLIKSTFYHFMLYFKSLMETCGMRQSEGLHAIRAFTTW